MSWDKIKNYLLYDPECDGVNKTVWDSVAYVSSVAGRSEITPNLTFIQLRYIVLEHKAATINRDLHRLLGRSCSVFAISIKKASHTADKFKFIKSCAEDNREMVVNEIGEDLLKQIIEFKIPNL